MKSLFMSKIRKVLQNKAELEMKLKVKIDVNGRRVSVKSVAGKEVDEYFAVKVLEALDYPFLIDDVLLLAKEEYLMEVLDIKNFTKRKNLEVIKARIIGRGGKTLDVLYNLTDCVVVVQDNDVAILGKAEDVHDATQAVISLIQGSKQGNVYSRLEKRNK